VRYGFARPLLLGGHNLIEEAVADSGEPVEPSADFTASDPASCSYHGWRWRGSCSCFMDWEGHICEQPRQWASVGCLGGPCAACSLGICHDPPVQRRGVERPFIYTYALPAGFNQLRPRVAMGRNTPYEFWRRLALSKHATSYPEEADYFFVPVSAMGVISHGVIITALRHVAQTAPHFNHSGGRDHLVISPWDFGASWLSNYPGLEHVRFMSHWGLTIQDKLYANDCPLCGPSYVAGKDFVVPDTLETQFATPPASKQPRSTLLFFSGRPTTRVREQLLALRSNRSDVKIVQSGVSNLAVEMDAARFCVGPPGAGFGTRATLAAARGCIPVLVGDHIAPVFDGLLDWSAFSVNVSEANISRLVDIVAAVTPAQEGRLRERVQAVSRHFVWREGDAEDAFETSCRYLLKFTNTT